MPGAFAYHLHSFSAADLRSFTNNWVGPLLAKGATCTMGCVSEPFLNLTPNVAVFLNALARGFSFGEAAWIAQPSLSWQTTVLGDPLYRPFSRKPAELRKQMAKENSPYLEWADLRVLDLELNRGLPLEKAAEALDGLDLTARSAVLSEKLAELYAAEGKPAAAIDYYEQALKLKPSPQQKIRLRLTLGTDLAAQNRLPEAADNYRLLLAENPDYPGKTNVEETLNQWAPKPVVPAKP